jgi:predicted NBD/HSP70 family sugar kinase
MILTIDIGGTKTRVMGFAGKKVVGEVVFPTVKDAFLLVEAIAEQAKKVFSRRKVEAVGVGVRGFVENGRVTDEILGWDKVDLRKLLKREFPGVSVLVENDANLGGLGVLRDFREAPKRLLYITLSTGIGGGMIVGGEIDGGLKHAEVGKIRLLDGGGMRSFENLASGRAFLEKYGKSGGEVEDVRVWRSYAEEVSRGILATLAVLRPDVIVVGGSMGPRFERFGGFLKEFVEQGTEGLFEIKTDIVAAKDPEHAVNYGAKALVEKRLPEFWVA